MCYVKYNLWFLSKTDLQRCKKKQNPMYKFCYITELCDLTISTNPALFERDFQRHTIFYVKSQCSILDSVISVISCN